MTKKEAVAAQATLDPIGQAMEAERVRLAGGAAAERERPDDEDAFSHMPDPVTMIDIAADTMTGDLRDFILDRLRYEGNKLPWHQRGEADQRDAVNQVEQAVREAVKKAVELIAAGGLKSIKARLEQVVVKDGIKAVITMSRFDDNRLRLMDSTGAMVLIVVADPDEFTGERAPVAVRPDQAAMTLEVSGVVHSEADGNRAEVPFE